MPRCKFRETGVFCSHTCSPCDGRMTRTADHHARRETRELGRMMRTAPASR